MKQNMNYKTLFFLALLPFFSAACSGTMKHTLNFNPLEPIRVAVLPVQYGESPKAGADDGKLLVDDIPLVFADSKDTPAIYVQRLIQDELSTTSLDVIAPAYVDAQLSHHGYTIHGKGFDIPKIFNADRAAICNDLLQCDALLYVKITRWDRSYYGIQAVNSVGIDLKLISARDGTVFYDSFTEDSEGRGLSKGPTGLSNIVLEPIKALSNDIIVELARKVVKTAVAPLRSSSRPEFLTLPPPAIFGSAHDSTDGTLRRSDPLTVVLLGTPKSVATFSIGNDIVNIPMVEKDDGHYYGQFFPLHEDRFSKLPLYVTLTDKFGRTARQRLGRIEVSLN